MRTYWLYLESYTMVFSEKERTLIYNTLSGEYIIINNYGKAYKLIQELISEPDIYLTQITEEVLSESEVFNFVKLLRNKFLAELIDCRLVTDQPVILVPKLRLMESVKENLEESISLDEDILSYLQKITIQLTGDCSNHCQSCNFAYKQHTVCHKIPQKEIPIGRLMYLMDYIKNSSVTTVYLTGGNPFSYSAWTELIHIFQRSQSLIFNICCTPEHLYSVSDDVKNILLSTTNVVLTIQIRNNISQDNFERLNHFLNNWKISKKFEFFIRSEEELAEIENCCKSIKSDLYEIKFLFQKGFSNIEVLLLDEESILSQISSKKDIFRRQVLNTHDFGSLIIQADGKVFGNINLEQIGDILEDDLPTILYQELNNGNSWLRIRKDAPCSNCIFQWLCPSPSNYELFVNRKNLCSVKHE